MTPLLLDNLLSYLFNGVGSIFTLIILIVDIIALYSVWNDKSLSGTAKLIWSLVIFFMPILGLILWFLLGKNSD